MKTLWLIGVGHMFPRDCTLGAIETLKSVDAVLALGSSLSFSERLLDLDVEAHDLGYLYQQSLPRPEIYQSLVEVVLDSLESRQSVAYLVQGHPLMYEWASAQLIEEAQGRRDLECKVLPAVSFVDHVLAELGVAIRTGVQVIDATSAVSDQTVLAPNLVLVVSQIGLFRRPDARADDVLQKSDLLPFHHYLEAFYPGDTRCTLCDNTELESGFVSLSVLLRDLADEAPYLSFATTLVIDPSVA